MVAGLAIPSSQRALPVAGYRSNRRVRQRFQLRPGEMFRELAVRCRKQNQVRLAESPPFGGEFHYSRDFVVTCTGFIRNDECLAADSQKLVRSGNTGGFSGTTNQGRVIHPEHSWRCLLPAANRAGLTVCRQAAFASSPMIWIGSEEDRFPGRFAG